MNLIEKQITAVKQLGRAISVYRPLPAPAKFHKSKAKYRYISGGNRSGKSESNIGYDCCSFAMGIHPVRRTPSNAVIWAVADTWPLVGKLLWKEKIKTYLPEHQIDGNPSWHNKSDEIPREIRLKCGTVIEFKAFEQGRTAFEGRAIDAIYIDEQCKNDSLAIFREMQARLEKPGSFMAWSMTPIRAQPWLEEKFNTLPKDYDVVYANLNDNRISRGGYIDDNVIDALIDEWPEEVQETRIKGYFASFMGAVYKTFSKRTHVIKPFPIPESWERYRGIDFGFNNPFGCLWAARSPDGIWYMYNEHYRPRATIASHAAAIDNTSGAEQYISTWADHDAQDRAELWDLGIFTIPARKELRNGVEAVQRMLKVRGNGKPRLYIFENCVNLIREISAYHYADGTDLKDPQDEPVKKDDHLLDCLRYIIYGAEQNAPLIITYEDTEKEYIVSSEALGMADFNMSDLEQPDDYDSESDSRSVDELMEAAGAWK